MTTLESKEIQIQQSIEKVYAFLADLTNHHQLMPESVYNWSATADECKFTIQNMATLELKVDERIANELIRVVPKKEAPFPLSLLWTVKAAGDHSIAKMTINAELNPFIKMIAVGPLQKLVDYQAERLIAVLNT